MRLIIIFSGLLFCLSGLSQSKGQPYKSYYFEGDEVVFEFDTRAYQTLTNKEGKQQLDFADLDIYEVAIAGNFNDWSQDEWKMKKVGPTRYQLRKKIDEFDDEFKWAFKFIINETYWTPPVREGKKAEKAKYQHLDEVTYRNDLWEEAYGEDLFPLLPDEEGNTRFFLPGHEDADKVVLSGSFNGWNERKLRMKPTDNGWALTINLPPGRHEYKFIVDGYWMEDPNNPNTVSNQYHTLNSVLDISKEVTFWLEGYDDAEKVYLAGSFNDWNPQGIRMRREGNTWLAKVELSGGKHWYKFVVDGQWMTDPENPIKEHDGKGNINSVLMIH